MFPERLIKRPGRGVGLLMVAVLFALAPFGCRTKPTVHDPEFTRVTRAIEHSWRQPPPVAAAAAVNPVIHELGGPQPVEVYIGFALSQNPGVQAAHARIAAAAMRVPQAASLKDPMLDVKGWPIYPNVPQTAAGRMRVDVMVSQEVPWFGKLEARSAAAEEEVNAARAQLAAAELKTIEQVKLAYFDLYYAQQALQIAERDRGFLGELVETALARYKTGKAGQQEVLRLQAEQANVEGELIQFEQMQHRAQAALAEALHVSPQNPLAALDALPHESVPTDIDTLYRQAVAARPELHAMLFDIARDRRMVDMAKLEYFPDATFQFGYGEMTTDRALAPTADGIDNLTLGLSMNLPIYRKRLNAAVREAELNVVAGARQYDQMKDEAQREVKELFTDAMTRRDLERLFRESIIPKSEQALEVSARGYQVGETDFADLIANWRELLRFQLAHRRIEAELRQSLASLERAVGGLPVVAPEEIPLPREERLPSPPLPLPAPE